MSGGASVGIEDIKGRVDGKGRVCFLPALLLCFYWSILVLDFVKWGVEILAARLKTAAEARSSERKPQNTRSKKILPPNQYRSEFQGHQRALAGSLLRVRLLRTLGLAMMQFHVVQI